jgi:hypothetical protein
MTMDLTEIFGIGGANCPCGVDHTKEKEEEEKASKRFTEICSEIDSVLSAKLDALMNDSSLAKSAFVAIMDICEKLMDVDMQLERILLICEGVVLTLKANIQIKAAAEEAADEEDAEAEVNPLGESAAAVTD